MKKSEFLKLVENKSKYNYDYSLVPEEWNNNQKTIIEIICPIHGTWKTSVRNFLVSKSGCPKCGHSTKLTLEEFINRARKLHGDKYDYSKVIYNGCDEKVCIICPKHGEFWQTPHSHIGNKAVGCPKCSAEISRYKKISKTNKIAKNTFITELENVVEDPIITDGKCIVGTIYCFVNKINKKKYIGKTVRSNYTLRFNEHRSRSYSNCIYFYRALEKYGWENFDKYVLFQTDVFEKTDENKKVIETIILNKETEYIKLYKTNISKYGYNLTEGGDGVCGYKFSEESIIKMKQSHSGKNHWNYGKKNSAGKIVLQFDLDGNFIKEYPSIAEANRQTGVASCNITQCCNNKMDSAGDYIWVKKEDYYDGYLQKYKSRAKCKSNDKEILQYTLNGEFVASYISASDAAESIIGDRKNNSNISKTASGKLRAAYGYIFIYSEDFTEDLLKSRMELLKNYKMRGTYKKTCND